MEKALTLHLTGTIPMLLHNSRLMNPLDPYKRQIEAMTKGNRNKTLDDYGALATLEARGGMYETPDGKIGLPAVNVRRALFDAAKAYRRGEQVKQGLLAGLDVVPILIQGSPQDCGEYLRGNDTEGRMVFVPVVVNRRRVMRARAKVPAGWEATVTMTILTDVLQPSHLGPIIERAGRVVGLGDWRPVYGKFTARWEVG